MTGTRSPAELLSNWAGIWTVCRASIVGVWPVQSHRAPCSQKSLMLCCRHLKICNFFKKLRRPEFSFCTGPCKFLSPSCLSGYKAYFISSHLSQRWIFLCKNSSSRNSYYLLPTNSMTVQSGVVCLPHAGRFDIWIDCWIETLTWWVSERPVFSFLVTEVPANMKQNYFIYFTNPPP